MEDCLTDGERDVWAGAATDPGEALDDELRALAVRFYRVMRHASTLQGDDGTLVVSDRLEGVLTSLQNARLRAIETKLKAESTDDATGADDFADFMDEAYVDRPAA